MILALYKNSLANLPALDELKDPKTRLQEFLQSRRLPLPEYEVVEVSGEAHNQHFRVSCYIGANDIVVEGEGRSRRKAEQGAARKALGLLKV